MSEFFIKLIQSGIIGETGNKTLYFIGVVIIIGFSYLVGSANFCRIISGRLDVENDPFFISQKIGGKIFLYYLFDGLKGFVCSVIGFVLMPGAGFASIGLLFCLFGHGFPVYFGFKSKGNAGVLAVMLGGAIVINPIIALISLIIAAIFYFAFRYVSLSGIVFTALFAFVNDRFMFWNFTAVEKNFATIINTAATYGGTLIAMLVVILLYATAFARLVRGKEEKVYFKKEKQ